MPVLRLRFCLLIAVAVASIKGNCIFSRKNDFPKTNVPLLYNQVVDKLVLPVKIGTDALVQLAAGDQIYVSCPGSNIKIFGATAVLARCVSGNSLDIGGSSYALSQLQCAVRIKESIQRSRTPCGGIGLQHHIGFEIQPGLFHSLITVCFEHSMQMNLYSSHVVRGPNLNAKEVVHGRPSFKKDTNFFTVSPDTCYEQEKQKDLFQRTYQIPNAIDMNKCRYFAKGHLAPDADFVSEAEQRATYYYINAAPQWQFFNNRNWRCTETRIRKLAQKRPYDIIVHSGTWRVLQMDDKNGNIVNILLGETERKPVLPAPLVMWKIVHDPWKNQAAAIVGLNSIEGSNSTVPLPCSGTKVKCVDLKWFDDMRTADASRGLLYCCTVLELRAAVTHAPNLGPLPLLKD